MNVAHMTVITPGRCGLYETTRELVAALRERGIDSRLVDPTKATNALYPDGDEDRGAVFGDMLWAAKSDLIVSHSGYDGTPIEATNQPVIHVAHGRPRSSFLGEISGVAPVYSYHYRLNANSRIASVVTFWPEHKRYLEVMFPDKRVDVVQSTVDLAAWTPEGPSGYGFNGHKDEVNIVCADAFRNDVDPFIPLNAFALWARDHRGAKLHLYGKPRDATKGWGALIKRIQDDGNMGEVLGWVRGLPNVYRAADAVITAHQIDVRTVREAMACGCPVVRVGEDLNLSLDALDRVAARSAAESRWHPRHAAEQFEGVMRAVA